MRTALCLPLCLTACTLGFWAGKQYMHQNHPRHSRAVQLDDVIVLRRDLRRLQQQFVARGLVVKHLVQNTTALRNDFGDLLLATELDRTFKHKANTQPANSPSQQYSADNGQQHPSRVLLDSTGETVSAAGLQVEDGKGFVTFGVDGDVRLERVDGGLLNIVANGVNIRGGNVSARNIEAIEEQLAVLVASTDAQTDTTNADAPTCLIVNTTGKDNNGVCQYVGQTAYVVHMAPIPVELIVCGEGHAPARSTHWMCTEEGGVAVPDAPLGIPFHCGAIDLSGAKDYGGSYLGPSNVNSNDPIDVARIGINFKPASDKPKQELCAYGENRANYIGGIEPTKGGLQQCKTHCAGMDHCAFFAYEHSNVDRDSGRYCRFFRTCDSKQPHSLYLAVIYARERCSAGAEPRVGLRWVCPEAGGVARPSGNLCAGPVCGVVDVSGLSAPTFVHPRVTVRPADSILPARAPGVTLTSTLNLRVHDQDEVDFAYVECGFGYRLAAAAVRKWQCSGGGARATPDGELCVRDVGVGDSGVGRNDPTAVGWYVNSVRRPPSCVKDADCTGPWNACCQHTYRTEGGLHVPCVDDSQLSCNL